MIKATNGVAVGGVTMPAWLPGLNEASIFAGQMVPILSALWLTVQIARFLVQWRKGRRDA